jgi:tetratricopeptide (TPR) repeat protein
MTGILLLAAVLGVQQSAATTATATLTEARRLINAGEPARAIEQLKTIATDRDPELQLQVRLLLGVAHYHAGEPARTVEILVPIVDRLPADSIERREAEQVLGLAAVVAGRYADAIPHLEATRRWAPDNMQLAYALAQAYIQTRKPDAARGTLAGMFKVAADSAPAHLIAAQVMTRLEMDSLAEPELAQALEKDPRLPSANLLLGQIALFRGRIPEAIVLTTKELAINPASANAFAQLGDAYVRQAQWDEAIAALQKSIWLNPYYSAPYILLGRAYMKKDQPAVAEGMLRRAIEFDPNNRTAHYQLAQLLQQAGREEEAKREFEIAEKLRSARER